jgi:thioredoxin 1
MATVELTLENFETTIAKDGITLVDFWAEWCGPCRMFGPIFEKAAEENLNIPSGKSTLKPSKSWQEWQGLPLYQS